MKVFLQEAVPEDDPIPGAVIAMQTLGDLIGHNPHCHILVTDGCFYGNKGMFRVAPPFELKKLDVIFQHKVKQPKSFCSTGRLTNPIPHPILCGQNSIDTQDHFSYAPTVKSNALSMQDGGF